MRSFRHCLALGTLVLAFLVPPVAAADEAAEAKAGPVAADPLDWPQWRGPEQNGISRETGLIDRWSPDGENLVWKNDKLGTRSTPIVLRGRLYTLCRHEPGTPRECEKVVCADAATGEVLWENRFNVFLSGVPKERVGWSCCAGDPATGRVYAMGVCDYFQCLDGETGETIWSKSLSEEYGFLNTYGGRTNVPIVFEDMVIVSAVVIGWGDMSVPAHRFVAFNKATGEPIWFNGTSLRPNETTYGTPAVAVLEGQAAMVFGSGDGGVWAFQPRTGRPIWSYQLSRRFINISPVVLGETVYIGHSEENPKGSTLGSFAALDASRITPPKTPAGARTIEPKWLDEEIMIGKCSPLVIDGRVYAMDDSGTLFTFDAETGQPIGKQKLVGTIGRASLLYGDGKIYACTTSAWHVLEPTASGVKIKHRLRFPQGAEVHGSPIVSHGRIYLPTTETMYCLGKADAEPAAAARPELPQEQPVDDDMEPADVQVVPVESLISPGETVQYKVRLYNARGQFLKEANDAEYSASGGGQVDERGLFTAADGATPAGVTVTAQVGKLSGKARVRVIPPMPWHIDFDNGEIPITWIGIRYRHVPLDFDLLQTLKDKHPRAAALYIFLTTSFVNGGKDQVSYNDRTLRRTWTELLRYLGLEKSTKMRSLEGAKSEIDEALQALVEEKVLANYEWTSKKGDVGLDVARGPRRVEGNGVMCKITTIPLGTDSQGSLGPADWHDYTVQADVRGARRNGKQPDIGLNAQRYTLRLIGTDQELRIRSWTSEPGRFSKVVPFAWQYDTWYTMKFRAAVEDGKAVLKGKVWPKGAPEPEEWSIEAVDDAPNVVGSPGLYGYATDAEIFLDNISVTPN